MPLASLAQPDGRVRYMPLTAHTLAEERSISYMVLFFGVLTSSTVIQMYTVRGAGAAGAAWAIPC